MDSLRLQGDEEVSPSFRAWIPFEWSFSSECGKEIIGGIKKLLNIVTEPSTLAQAALP